jgi:hypothetical protein
VGEPVDEKCRCAGCKNDGPVDDSCGAEGDGGDDDGGCRAATGFGAGQGAVAGTSEGAGSSAHGGAPGGARGGDCGIRDRRSGLNGCVGDGSRGAADCAAKSHGVLLEEMCDRSLPSYSVFMSG